MRAKTINILTKYSSKDITIINKKKLFPTLSPSPKDLQIVNLKKRNPLSLHKKFHSEKNNNITFTKRLKLNPNVKMVNILNFEEDVDQILNSNLDLKKKRDKLDKNKTNKKLR